MAATLGPQLRAKREQSGLTLDDVAHQTRIPAARLRCLEKDDLASFGSATYARGFLRIYSDFLGVDPAPILGNLPSSIAAKPRAPSYPFAVPPYGIWGGPAAATNRQTAHTPSPLPAAAVLLIIWLGFAGVWVHHLTQEWAQMEQQRGLEAVYGSAPGLAQPSPHQQRPLIVKAIPVEEEDLQQSQPTGAQ